MSLKEWDAEKTILKPRKTTIGLNVCAAAVGFAIDAPNTRIFVIYVEN